MSIVINDFSIIDNGSKISVNINTLTGFNITSILLWDINTFKNYSLAIDLNYKIEGINEFEIFIITAEELGISKFEDLYFIEIESDAPYEQCPKCINPALGITYNLSQYYMCMLDSLFKLELNDCEKCNDLLNKNTLFTISLLIDSIIKSVEIGFYLQAIENIQKLKKLCEFNQCKNCNKIQCNSCGQFNQLN